MRTKHLFITWSCIRNKGRFCTIKLVEVLPPHSTSSFLTDRSLFSVLCYSFCLSVRLWFYMRSFFYFVLPFLFQIAPSLGTPGRLCFVSVALPGYLHFTFNSYETSFLILTQDLSTSSVKYHIETIQSKTL